MADVPQRLKPPQSPNSFAEMAAKAKAMSHENAAGRVAEIAVGLIKDK